MNRRHRGRMLDWRSLGRDLADLVLARSCAGCEAPGSVLCAACWRYLTRGVLARDLPDGTTARASANYLGIGKSVVIAHKEHGWHALTPLLGVLLARAVTCVTADPVLLVPIPPHAHSLARRGTDPLADIVNAATRELKALGQPAGRADVLIRTRDAGASKLLGREERRRAVESSFAITTDGLPQGSTVVIVDDVITTGLTVSEARRTLERGGIAVCGVAAVASTPMHGARR